MIRPRNLARRATFVCALATTSCAPHRAGKESSRAEEPSRAEVAPLHRVSTDVAVHVLPRPGPFHLDGYLGDWHDRRRSHPAAEAPRARRGRGEPEPPAAPASGKNPEGARSFVAIAVERRALLVAAELSPAVSAGVWLGIGGGIPELAPVGHPTASGSLRPFDCESGEANARPDAELAAACRRQVARHEAFRAAHRARFTRMFHLGRHGVTAFEAGRLAPIAGAAWAIGSRDGGGMIVEAELPLTAMPRVDEGTIRKLRLIARDAREPPPEPAEGAPWVWFDVPPALSTDDEDALRAAVFDALDAGTFHPAGASHQPGEPDVIEVVRYPAHRRDELVRDARAFHDWMFWLPPVRVGVMHAFGDWLTVATESAAPKIVVKELGLGPMDLVRPPELRGVVKRGDELHAFFVMPRPPTAPGSEGIGWTVIAVRRDGSLRTDLVDRSGEPPRWADVTCTASPDFTALVATGPSRWPDGEGAPTDPPVEVRLELAWDAKTGTYRLKQRTPPLRSPAPR